MSIDRVRRCAGDDGVLLEVGVGANDREAFQMMHGDIPTVEALAVVVEAVADYRSPEARQHPLNRLGQERYLRWHLEEASPTSSAAARRHRRSRRCLAANLQGSDPVRRHRCRSRRRRHAVVCSVGVDLDLVGSSPMCRRPPMHPVIVALPGARPVPIAQDLLGLLATPVDVRTV